MTDISALNNKLIEIIEHNRNRHYFICVNCGNTYMSQSYIIYYQKHRGNGAGSVCRKCMKAWSKREIKIHRLRIDVMEMGIKPLYEKMDMLESILGTKKKKWSPKAISPMNMEET